MFKSTRFRLSLSLTLIVVSVLLASTTLGLFPDRDGAVVEGRAALCESLAVTASTLLNDNNHESLRAAMEATLKHNVAIDSIGIRQADGELLLTVGDHPATWRHNKADHSHGSRFHVSIWDGDAKWGAIEVQYRSDTAHGFLAGHTELRYILFVSLALAVLFPLFLRQILLYLDPNQTVPDRVRSAMDTLAEGVVILNEDDRIVLANSAIAALLGRSTQDLVGMNISALPLLFPDNGPTDEPPWILAKRNRAAVRNVLTHLDGSAAPDCVMQLNCLPIAGPNGRSRGAMLSFEDITQIGRINEELRVAKAEADQANRAKSDFLASMSHEIRTPMNAVMGFAELLRSGSVDDAEERHHYATMIHSSGKHLLDLINEILDLSKIEAGRLQIEQGQCSPHELLAEVGAVLGVQAKQKGILFEVTADGELPETICTDSMRLRQILTNLIGNAIKFTNVGIVRVIARFQAGSAGNQFIVQVADTGVGIAEEHLENIFEPFTQADGSTTKRFGGTGLGLTICRRLARCLGGDVTVTSQLGKGSSFTASIDAGSLDGVAGKPFDAACLASHVESERIADRKLPPAHVLVVDDVPENREFISIILTRAGVTVTTADNGLSAIAQIADDEFDVILMDVEMPVMDGMTAVRRMRELGIDAPIIALTAHAMAEQRSLCFSAGYSHYLTKPISITLLLNTLAELLHASGPSRSLAARKRESAPLSREVASADEFEPLVSTLPADDPEFQKYIVMFVQKIGSYIEQMHQSIDDEDFEQLRMVAHSVKGSGGLLGFDAFTEPAARLEQLAQEHRRDEAREMVDCLARLAQRIVIPTLEGSEQHALVQGGS